MRIAPLLLAVALGSIPSAPRPTDVPPHLALLDSLRAFHFAELAAGKDDLPKPLHDLLEAHLLLEAGQTQSALDRAVDRGASGSSGQGGPFAIENEWALVEARAAAVLGLSAIRDAACLRVSRQTIAEDLDVANQHWLHRQRAEAHGIRGAHDDAARSWLSAAERARAVDRPDAVALMLAERARSLTLGGLDAATALEEARAASRPITESARWQDLRAAGVRAEVANRLGRPVEAFAEFGAALRSAVTSDQHPLELLILAAACAEHALSTDFRQTGRATIPALAAIRKSEADLRLSVRLRHLASEVKVARLRSATTAGMRGMEQFAAQLEPEPMSPTTRARFLEIRGIHRGEGGDVTGCLADLEAALEILGGVPEQAGLRADLMRTEASVLAQTGRLADAQARIEEADALHPAGTEREKRSRAEAQAYVALAEGRAPDALRALGRAAASWREEIADLIQNGGMQFAGGAVRIERDFQTLVVRAFLGLEPEERGDEEVELLLQSLITTLEWADRIREHTAVDPDTAPEEVLELAERYAVAQAEVLALVVAPPTGTLSERRALRQRVFSAKERSSDLSFLLAHTRWAATGRESRRSVPPLPSLTEMQNALQEREATVVVLREANETLVVAFDRNRRAIETSPMTPRRCAELAVQQFHALERPFDPNAGAELRDLLFPRAVLDLLAEATRIHVVTFSNLNSIPFESLPDPRGEGPWGARCGWVRVRSPAGRFLAAPRPPLQGSALICGAPGNDSELEGALAECGDLAARFDARLAAGTTRVDASRLVVRLGQEATEAGFREALGDRPIDLLHFAGHGNRTVHKAYRSQLRFEPSQVDPHPSTDDGYLSEEELAALPLDGTLVVLSGCKTSGTASPGWLGTTGPSEGALRAGARAVVCNLSETRDGRARAFIDWFYEALEDGAPADVALARARSHGLAAGWPARDYCLTVAWAR